MKKSRIDRQKETAEKMIRLYCRRKEGNAILCDDCRTLLDYAMERLERCPHGALKPSCKNCRTHCYRPAMKEKIRRVMRFAGPRMLFYHPLDALRYLAGK